MFEEATINVMPRADVDAALRQTARDLTEKRTVVARIFEQAGSTIDLMRATDLTKGTSEERATELQTIQDEIDALSRQHELLQARSKKLDDEHQALLRMRDQNAEQLRNARGTSTEPVNGLRTPTDNTEQRRFTVPATAKRFGHLDHYKDEAAAFRDGMFILAAIHGRPEAKRWCQENGVELRGLMEGDDSAGGYLVTDTLETTLINLKETYGVIRRNARNVPMKTERHVQPRLKAGMKAKPVGEVEASTAQKPEFNRIALTAKDWQIISKISRDLSEDAAMNVADIVVGEFAPAFALAEDEAGFLGDGTSTYHGITGIVNKIKGLDSTRANVASIVIASGNLWSEIVKKDLLKMTGKLPGYALQMPNKVKWYCHNNFWATTMLDMVLSAGGAAARDLEEGGKPRFLGYDVEITQVMPSTEANDHCPVILGNLSQGVAFGDRRASTIEFSKDALNSWEQREIAIQSTERFDIVVHEAGNADASAANHKPGPIIALFTAAS